MSHTNHIWANEMAKNQQRVGKKNRKKSATKAVKVGKWNGKMFRGMMMGMGMGFGDASSLANGQ